MTDLAILGVSPAGGDPPLTDGAVTPPPNVTAALAITPPELNRKSRAKPLEEHVDPRDSKMISPLGDGRFVAYYGREEEALSWRRFLDAAQHGSARAPNSVLMFTRAAVSLYY